MKIISIHRKMRQRDCASETLPAWRKGAHLPVATAKKLTSWEKRMDCKGWYSTDRRRKNPPLLFLRDLVVACALFCFAPIWASVVAPALGVAHWCDPRYSSHLTIACFPWLWVWIPVSSFAHRPAKRKGDVENDLFLIHFYVFVIRKKKIENKKL